MIRMKQDRKHYQQELNQKQMELKKQDDERKEKLMRDMTEKQKMQFLNDLKNFQDQQSKQGAIAEKKRVSSSLFI